MNELATKLHKVLANTYHLYLTTQNYHWNVTGIHFAPLHAMFQDQYEEMALAIDELAEKIRALDEKVPGSFTKFGKVAEISEPNHNATAEEMLKDLLKGHESMVAMIEETLKTVDDESTFDLLVGRLNVHTKTIWMLKSTLA